jgi:hypothetical protein
LDAHGEVWAARHIPDVSSKRDWIAAGLLSIFVGVLAIDRLYLGKVGTGILKLPALGGLLIWAIIDVIPIALKRLDDKEGFLSALPVSTQDDTGWNRFLFLSTQVRVDAES